MTKCYENALLAAHLSKTQGVMPDFGCRQHQEMDRQSSPARRGLVQLHQSSTWKCEVFISSHSSALSSWRRQLTFKLYTAAAHCWVIMAFHVKTLRSVPSGLQGAARTSLFAGEHPCRDRAFFCSLIPHGNCSRTCWHGQVRVCPSSQTDLDDCWCVVLLQLLTTWK